LVAKDSDRLAAARADLKQAFKSCPLKNAYPSTEISTLQSTPEKFGAPVGLKIYLTSPDAGLICCEKLAAELDLPVFDLPVVVTKPNIRRLTDELGKPR
jgi:hypothetical protein